MLGYLTKINVGDAVVEYKDFANSYYTHQALWEAFPKSKTRDFLFTFKQLGDNKNHILLFSKVEPVIQNWGDWVIKEIHDSFLSRPIYYFELTLNPVSRKAKYDAKGQKQKNGRKVPITTFLKLTQWVRSKADQNGFSFTDLHLSKPDYQNFQKEKDIKLNKVIVTGTLQVEDFDKFKKAFRNGIGPSKAFGFGMMLLKSYR